MDVASSAATLTSALPLPRRSSMEVVSSLSNFSAPTKPLQSQFYGLGLSLSSSLPIPAHSSPPKTQTLSALRRGKVAPNLFLQNQNGQKVEVRSFRGQPSVAYVENFETAGATVDGSNDDSSRSYKILQKSVLKNKVKYRLARDRGDRVDKEWGVEGRQSFVLHENGAVKHVYKNQLRLKNHRDLSQPMAATRTFSPMVPSPTDGSSPSVPSKPDELLTLPSMFFPFIPPKKPGGGGGSSPAPGGGSSPPPDGGSPPPAEGGSKTEKKPGLPFKTPLKLPIPFMPKLPIPFKPGGALKPTDDDAPTTIPFSPVPKDKENVVQPKVPAGGPPGSEKKKVLEPNNPLKPDDVNGKKPPKLSREGASKAQP